MKQARRAATLAPTVTLTAAALFFWTSFPAEAQSLRGRRGITLSPGSRMASPSSDQADAAGRMTGRQGGSLTFGSPSFVRLPPRAPQAATANTRISPQPLSARSSPIPDQTIAPRPQPQRPWGWQRRHGTVVQPGDSIDWAGGNAVFLRPGRVIQLRNYGVTIFQGYSSVYGAGLGYVSPFAVYNCPPYIGASSVLLSTPYLYASGWERGTAAGWAENGRPGYEGGANDYRDRSLRAALNDLSRFWEENDVRALRRRVSPSLAVAVFGGERHLYSLREADFLALAADALDRVRTISLRFDDVRDRSDGLVNAYAVHVYRLRGEDGSAAPHVATLRYTLVHVDGDWYVSAISLAPGIAS